MAYAIIRPMSSADVLEQTEKAIAGLSTSDRERLFRKFALGANQGIEKSEGVMGGAA